jgi:hypothetical protein
MNQIESDSIGLIIESTASVRKKNETQRVIIFSHFNITSILSYSVFLLFENQDIILLTKEYGFFESLGAIFFLIASIFFFIIFWKDRSGNDFQFFKTKRNICFLLLGLVFFVGFGEEISWG